MTLTKEDHLKEAYKHLTYLLEYEELEEEDFFELETVQELLIEVAMAWDIKF